MEESNKKLLKNILRSRNILSATDEDDDQNIILETNHYSPPQGVLSSCLFVRQSDHQAVEKDPSKSLFVKHSKKTDDMDQSLNLSMFFNEAYFYCKIVPFFQTYGDISSLLHCYLGSSLNTVGNTEKCVMVAENLQAVGYQHISPKSRWDYPHLALVMEELGKLHAFSYKAKTSDPKRFYSLVSNLNNNIEPVIILLTDMLKRNLIGILESIRQDEQFMQNNALSVRNTEYVAENLLTELRKQLAVDPCINKNLVLCHGDSNPMNFMFKYENKKPTNVKFIDFTNCQLGSPTLDLVYFLYSATDEKMRHEHWDDLIDLYYSALSRTFSDNIIPSKSSIINDFPLQALWPGCVGIHFAPYLMAIDEFGANLSENLPLSDIGRIAETKFTERISIFKDMVRRNFI